jgi:hypothetical protein
MKKLLPSIAVFICLPFLFSSCLKDTVKRTYTIYRPIIELKAEVLKKINGVAATSVQAPGKFYLYGNYVFLNEIDKGVHVIDNSNPVIPKRVAFINIPGNLDIAVKGNTLYADLYTDLLAIDISNPLNVKVTKTIPHSFPERRYLNGYGVDSIHVIVGWTKKDTTVYGDSFAGFGCANCSGATGVFVAAQSNGRAAGVPGVAGSMSRFAIVNNYLYAVNSWQLNTLDINNSSSPSLVSSISAGRSLETIYPFKDKLFIGSEVGMSIVDIGNPAKPLLAGQVSHFRGCDPVVADDKYAFVTLRSGVACSGANNQLDVVNVENINAPFLIKSYPLTNPHGLAKAGNLLFICDGTAGLKVFDATDPLAIKRIQEVPVSKAYDVVAYNNMLFLVAEDGFYQYSYNAAGKINLVSQVQINRN